MAWQRSTWRAGDPAYASIEAFDPTVLRCEVLRRYAMETRREMLLRAAASSGGRSPGGSTAAPQQAAPAARDSSAVSPPPANSTVQSPASQDADTAPTSTEAAPAVSEATPAGAEGASASASSSSAGSSPSAPPQAEAAATPVQPERWTPRALLRQVLEYVRSSIREQLTSLVDHFKVSTYLSFKRDSLFRDACVEELYQRNRMQHWSPKLEWSTVAFLQMLIWDLAANPSHRLHLIFLFYAAFLAIVVVHKCLAFIMPYRPICLRIERGVLLCSFLLSRGLACQPLLMVAVQDDPNTWSVQSLKMASSLIGLGMTNLSAVLALQLDTLDTFLLCLTHFIACAVWAAMALRMAAGDTLSTLILCHCLVACICVWQQHEQERFDRISFEQELLVARGMLLRSSDKLSRQSPQAEFSFSYRALYQARTVEHINF